jgi:hypothetical protein
MAYKEIISSWAENDISDILHYSPNQGATLRFLNEFSKIVELLTIYPFAFSVRYKNTRIVPFKKLPFKLVYQVIEPEIVFIIAVLHEKRNDNTWMERS